MYPNKPGQIWKFQYKAREWDLTYNVNELTNGHYMFIRQETVGSSLYYKFYNVRWADELSVTIQRFLSEGNMWELIQDV